MIKLEIIIEDDVFKYSYEVGASKAGAEMKLNEENLGLFTDLLRRCSKSFHYKLTQQREDIMVEARVKEELAKTKKK